MYTNVQSSSIQNSQKGETVQMSITEGWVNKLWYIHIMEYYSAINRNRLLLYATI